VPAHTRIWRPSRVSAGFACAHTTVHDPEGADSFGVRHRDDIARAPIRSLVWRSGYDQCRPSAHRSLGPIHSQAEVTKERLM
jgi:hypothetical protein